MHEILDKDYIYDLNKIKETIRDNQNKAMVVVNSAMIMTYYEIGTIINKRKTWGSKYIQKLSEDLKEYGKGYSSDQLRRMARFADEFSVDEIRAQPVPKIPWSTIIAIMNKSKSHEEMLWYINETHKRGWSRSMVLNQFDLKAYERSFIEPVIMLLKQHLKVHI
jgi:predicted nuclease of restriction endonuclease-like (RecB) superfamily